MIREKILAANNGDVSCLYYSIIQPEGEEERFNALLDKIGPFGNALEIGTYAGLSSAVISKHCKKLHCIDILDHQDREKNWRLAGVENATFHHIVGDKDKGPIVFKHGPFDFAFVDGDHTTAGALNDMYLLEDVPVIVVDNIDYPDVLEAVTQSGRRMEINGTYCIAWRADVQQ